MIRPIKRESFTLLDSVRLIMGETWNDERPQTQLVFIGEEHGINSDDLQARFDACQTE